MIAHQSQSEAKLSQVPASLFLRDHLTCVSACFWKDADRKQNDKNVSGTELKNLAALYAGGGFSATSPVLVVFSFPPELGDLIYRDL